MSQLINNTNIISSPLLEKLSDPKRCIACLQNNKQCSYRKKKNQSFCGIHIKQKNCKIFQLDSNDYNFPLLSPIAIPPQTRTHTLSTSTFENPKKRKKTNHDPIILDYSTLKHNKFTLKKFRLKDIKHTMKYYGKKDFWKTKIENFTFLKNLLIQLETFTPHLPQITHIQSCFRGFIVRNYNSNRGPALFKRQLSNNDIDFLTFEPINKIYPTEFFSYKDSDGFIYSFHIRSIYELIQQQKLLPRKKTKTISTNDHINPYNRKPFPQHTIQSLNKITIFMKNNGYKLEIKSEKITDPYLKMKASCVDIFQSMDKLDLYTQVGWFLDLSRIDLKKLYKEIEDIWNYRVGLTDQMKKEYIDVNKGKAFALSPNDFNKIHDKIKLQNILLHEFRRLIIEGQTREHCITASYWILTGLTFVSEGAANGNPHLVQASHS